MNLQRIHLAYFSATGTTARYMQAISKGIDAAQTNTIKLTEIKENAISIPANELIVFGIPVFSGRIPQFAQKAIQQLKGNNTPAIITCIYGNRDFDDALVELKDLVQANGFNVVSAAAFVAQHSIFPKVAKGRPHAADLAQATQFGVRSIQNLHTNAPITIKGNYPYRAIKPVPLHPTTTKQCNNCGHCMKQCPVQAMHPDNPKKIDKKKCISCMHCISICPKQAKKLGGLLYWIASKKFNRSFAMPRENYIVYQTC